MNWLLKMPTQLANIKEVVDAEAVSVDSSYRSTWHKGWQNEKEFEDELMAVGPLDSMSQSLSVDEVQVKFLTPHSILLKQK